METIQKLEATAGKWYQSMPHLPKEMQKWLSTNVWWIVLIGVIISALALLNVFFFTILAGSFLAAFGGGIGAAIFIGVLVSVALGVVAIILGGMAVNPLKAMRKKGWTLLFTVLLAEIASTIVTNVLSFNLFGLIWGLLWVAVSGYFLFEIHSYFGTTASSRKDKKKIEAHQK